MLRAYDYSEDSADIMELKNERLFNEEKMIAQEYVIKHSLKTESKHCPICNSGSSKFIFTRWDINYQFCNDCKSIFVPADNETLYDYLELDKMKKLRLSDEYQSEAELRRAAIWSDLVMWAEYRSYRYLGKNIDLDIIDYGNRYLGSINRFKESRMCGHYDLQKSIISMDTVHLECADVVLYLNQIQHESDPEYSLRCLYEKVKDDGILILNTRLGSGFDILTLKGGIDNIFPYEHILLPSKRGLEILLNRSGFELLEITTPGTRDMETVLKNKDRIEESNFFIKYLIDVADHSILTNFQQFLQKSGLSSFAQVIARKRKSL